MESPAGSALQKHALLWLIIVAQCSPALGCGAHYELGIEEVCLTRFRLDMQELGQSQWCNWKDTAKFYEELTNCTYLLALNMNCYWPNRLVDVFFIQVHRRYFHNCSMYGRRPRDPPNHILASFIVVPILVTILMAALVVWRSKRSEGII